MAISRRRPFPLRLLMALLAVALFALSYQWGNQWQQTHQQPMAIAGMLLHPPVPLPDWQLETAAGQQIGSAELANHWILLAFASQNGVAGHLAMARMIEVFNRLADRPRWRESLRLILVTPSMANPHAADFGHLLANAFVLTGADDERNRLFALLSGPSNSSDDNAVSQPPIHTQPRLPKAKSDAGSVTGSDTGVVLYLINPEGELTTLFPAGQSAAEVAEDLRRLADQE